jgi:hypothetical protein
MGCRSRPASRRSHRSADLSASEFSGGRLDWSSFDVNGALAVDSTGDKPFKSLVE